MFQKIKEFFINWKRKIIFKRFAKDLVKNQRDMDPETQKVTNDHFWEMIGNDDDDQEENKKE